MLKLELLTTDTAPPASAEILKKAEASYGFVPNLMAALAHAPAAVGGYAEISAAFASSSLSRVEQQVVLLATSYENRCHYCMAAHSTVAGMAGAPPEVVAALRDGDPIPVPRLEALRTFTASVVRNRGFVPEQDLLDFVEAGFDRAQALEVVTGIAQKTLSNYVNHLVGTPLDEAFERAEWLHPEERVAGAA